QRNEDLDPRRDHRPLPSAAATCRNSSASKPRRTTMRASPTTISTSGRAEDSGATARDAGACVCLRTTRAIFGAVLPPASVFSRLAQYRSVDASYANALANSSAVFPLARQSRTRSDHFAAVAVIRARMQARRHPRKDAPSCRAYRRVEGGPEDHDPGGTRDDG